MTTRINTRFNRLVVALLVLLTLGVPRRARDGAEATCSPSRAQGRD